VAQQGQGRILHYETVGQVMLGVSPETGTFQRGAWRSTGRTSFRTEICDSVASNKSYRGFESDALGCCRIWRARDALFPGEKSERRGWKVKINGDDSRQLGKPIRLPPVTGEQSLEPDTAAMGESDHQHAVHRPAAVRAVGRGHPRRRAGILRPDRHADGDLLSLQQQIRPAGTGGLRRRG